MDKPKRLLRPTLPKHHQLRHQPIAGDAAGVGANANQLGRFARLASGDLNLLGRSLDVPARAVLINKAPLEPAQLIRRKELEPQRLKGCLGSSELRHIDDAIGRVIWHGKLAIIGVEEGE